MSTTEDSVKPDMAHASDAELVTAVRLYIERYPGTRLVHKRLASELGVTPTHLDVVFRRRLGVSVAAFVRHERLRIAQRLLMQTSMPIQEIALELGFSGAANFSTSFRELVGITPTEFRNNPPELADLTTTCHVKWG